MVKYYGEYIAVFSMILVAYLIFAYFLLWIKLSQTFVSGLPEDFNKLRTMFTVITATYFFYGIYNSAYGHIYELICKTNIRWLLNDLAHLIFESIIILAILNLHSETMPESTDV